MNLKVLLGVVMFILAQVMTWFQLNGQFLWKYFKDNPLIIGLMGIPISYCFMWATKYTVQGMDGMLWPARFIGFGIGIVVYAGLVGFFFQEGFSLKTLVSLMLAVAILLIQIFWK